MVNSIKHCVTKTFVLKSIFKSTAECLAVSSMCWTIWSNGSDNIRVQLIF